MSVSVVPLLEELLGLLQTLNETKGVPEGQNLSEKNILQDSNSDPNKKNKSSLSSEEEKKTKNFATIFAKTFLEIQRKSKKDTALKTSVQKITPNSARVTKTNNVEPKKQGSLLGGLLALLGGVGALIMGLLTDGPFKGALKLLSKLGISGAVKMLMASAKGLLATFTKFVTAPFRFAGKLLGKGFMGKVFSALKPLAKILKKVPLIGSIISIGFAISRFKSGDTVGGVIDVLSALSGLLNLIPGGSFVAIPLSIGLDILNAWLDAKTAGAQDKNAAKMDILGDMAKSVGKWIWDNALWLPVIGGFKRWGMAYDAFKGGNIMEGLKQLGLGLLSFGGMGPIIMGIEALMGFSSSTEQQTDLKPNTSWFGGFKKWIKDKLNKLPAWLRKPLEWFGILDETSTPEANINASESGGVWQKITGWFSNLWDSITPSIQAIGEWFSNIFKSIKDTLSGDFVSNMIESIKNTGASIMNMVGDILNTLKNVFDKVIGTIKNINIFGDKENDTDLLSKAKQAGWNSVEEYRNANWSFNDKNKNKIEIVDEKRKEHVDDLVLIGKEQVAILSDIRNIGMQTLKVLANNSGGSVNPIIMPSSSGSSKSKSPSQVSLNTSRGDYGSSPYAFA